MIHHDTTNGIIRKLSNQTNTAAALTTIATLGAGTSLLLSDDKNDTHQNAQTSSDDQNKTHRDTQISSISENDKEINLWQYCRFFTIMNIPVIDFIAVYILLYIINTLCPRYNYKLILVATIPITILLNIIINKKVKITGILLVILLISMYYLLSMNMEYV